MNLAEIARMAAEVTADEVELDGDEAHITATCRVSSPLAAVQITFEVR